MERYRKLFLDESLKHLRSVEEQIVGTEDLDQEGLDSVFREIHSLKGMAASMGYEAMADLSHRLEDLLHRRREAKQKLPAADRDLCVRVFDRLIEMRDEISAGGTGSLDWSDLEPMLSASDAEGPESEGLAVRIRLDPDCTSPAARAYLILIRFREVDPDVRSQPSEREILQGIPVDHLDLTLHGVTSEDVEALYETLTEVAGLEILAAEESSDSDVDAALELESPDGMEAESPTYFAVPPEADEAKVRLPDTVQAPVQLLDEFVDLLGEMTISRSHLDDMARSLDSEILQEEVDRLGKLVRSFHTRVMSLRMLPFSLITGRLKRLVREHSTKLGKEVDFTLAGEEIGMDKSILLQVSDPLLHLLRNALDHGIESPEERGQRGKPPRGTIEIRASRVRNRVEITVADDGRGIDVERVRRKAVEAGLYKEEQSRRLGNPEILSCLFRPGFTTRSDVSELSGRGVGLDVVKSKVDALGGTLQVVTHPGGSTEFRLSLPLSVAIVPVLMVEVGKSVLAVPTSNVVRTLEAQPRDIRKLEGGHVLLTEKGQVPILGLGRVLGLEGQQRFERMPLVLVQTSSGITALVVDCFFREEDLFIKPIRGPLKRLQGLSGYSVLGDGRLVFLLDPQALLA